MQLEYKDAVRLFGVPVGLETSISQGQRVDFSFTKFSILRRTSYDARKGFSNFEKSLKKRGTLQPFSYVSFEKLRWPLENARPRAE